MNRLEMALTETHDSHERRAGDRRRRPSPLGSAMSFRLQPSTHDAICQVAEELGISVAEVVRRALAIVERRSKERRSEHRTSIHLDGAT